MHALMRLSFSMLAFFFGRRMFKPLRRRATSFIWSRVVCWRWTRNEYRFVLLLLGAAMSTPAISAPPFRACGSPGLENAGRKFAKYLNYVTAAGATSARYFRHFSSSAWPSWRHTAGVSASHYTVTFTKRRFTRRTDRQTDSAETTLLVTQRVSFSRQYRHNHDHRADSLRDQPTDRRVQVARMELDRRRA